jgi:molybdopterin molybdotransferase
LTATPLPSQDSSLVSILARADCLIIRPPRAPAAEPGELVEIMRLDF